MNQTVNVLLYLCKNADQLEEIDLQGCNKFDLNDISCALGPLANRTALRSLDLTSCNGKYGLGDLFLCPNDKSKLEELNLNNLKLKELITMLFSFITIGFSTKSSKIKYTVGKRILNMIF